jgi:hypothetical protein
MTYQDYLSSRAWRFTKWLRKDSKCAECNATKRLQLHHEEYTWHNKNPRLRMWLPNILDEMVTLCDYHHEMRHK